jgi:hypothetical protein
MVKAKLLRLREPRPKPSATNRRRGSDKHKKEGSERMQKYLLGVKGAENGKKMGRDGSTGE